MRLTPTGISAVVAALVSYALGVVLGYPTLAAIGLAILVAVLAALVIVSRRPLLQVQRRLDHRRCRVGDRAIAVLEVTNIGARSSPPSLVSEPTGRGVVRLAVPRLSPGESIRLDYDLPTSRRAVLVLGPVEVQRDDPFGLVTWRQTLTRTDTFWVNPRTIRLPPQPSGRRRDLEGPASNSAMQGTAQFHALREYVPGDDRRHIHWRSSARNNKLMVVEHVDVTRPKATVVLDVTREHYDEDRFETAVAIAGSVLVSAVERGFPVRLLVTDGTRLEEEQRPDAHLLLDGLSGVQLQDDAPLGRAATWLARDRAGSTLTVITGNLDPMQLAPLRPLTGRFDAVSVVAVAAPGDGAVPVTAAGLPLLVVSSVDDVARAWVRGSRW